MGSNREAKGIKDGNNPRVGGDKRTRRNVGAEDTGFVLADSGNEKIVLANEREAIVTGNWSERDVFKLGSTTVDD